MPTYTFKNKETNEVTEIFMKIAEREKYLEDNPSLEQIITSPNFSYNDAKKPDDAFRDILRKIKKEHPKGNINTF